MALHGDRGQHPPAYGGLVDKHHAARELGVSPKTLEAWRARGEGPPFVRLSRTCVRYALTDLRDFIAARTICR